MDFFKSNLSTALLGTLVSFVFVCFLRSNDLHILLFPPHQFLLSLGIVYIELLFKNLGLMTVQSKKSN